MRFIKEIPLFLHGNSESKMSEKKDAGRFWKVLSSEYLHKEPWFTVRRECVELPNGTQIPSYYVLEYPEWVNVIAITRDKQFVMVKQYRHALGAVKYELCAGVCDPEDATPLMAAQRELLKKQALAAVSGANICNFRPMPAQ